MSAIADYPGAPKVPEVSQAEIDAFHSEHFSTAAVQLFSNDFLQPQPNLNHGYHEEEEYYYDDYEEDDDGLGYYPDGVKRTLTNEQIAIFRHSELEALRRAEEKTSYASQRPARLSDSAQGDFEAEDSALNANTELPEEGEDGEEGEIESDTPRQNPTVSSSKKKKKKKNKSKNNRQSSNIGAESSQKGEHGWFKKTVKPDLRKRTWDVVETGMDSLDYDGLEAGAGSGSGRASQRRKISYDD